MDITTNSKFYLKLQIEVSELWSPYPYVIAEIDQVVATKLISNSKIYHYIHFMQNI